MAGPRGKPPRRPNRRKPTRFDPWPFNEYGSLERLCDQVLPPRPRNPSAEEPLWDFPERCSPPSERPRERHWFPANNAAAAAEKALHAHPVYQWLLTHVPPTLDRQEMFEQLLEEAVRLLQGAPRRPKLPGYFPLQMLALDLCRQTGTASTQLLREVATCCRLDCDDRTLQRYVLAARKMILADK